MLAGLNTFIRYSGRKLPYDAEIEYLESTGTQWIDTGLKCSSGMKSIIRALTTRRSGSQHTWGLCGYMSPYNSNCMTHDYVTFNGNTLRSVVSPLPTMNTIYEAVLDLPNRVFMRDGKVISRVADFATYTSNYSWYLGKVNNIKEAGLSGRIYSCQIYVDNVLVRDFQPVRFTNEQGVTEGAMFDRANPTVGMNPDRSPRTDGLYRNIGTGSFILGPDIVQVKTNN